MINDELAYGSKAKKDTSFPFENKFTKSRKGKTCMARISTVIDKILCLYQPTFKSGPFLLFHGDRQYWGGKKGWELKARAKVGICQRENPIARASKLPPEGSLDCACQLALAMLVLTKP